MVFLLTLVYFCQNLTSYGLATFMPSIVKAQSGIANNQVIGVLTSLPFVMALIGILVNGRLSDRSGERIWHVAVPLTMWSIGLVLVFLVDGMQILPVLVMIFCVGTFLNAHLPAFWPIPTIFLGSTAAASAIGFINMIGNLGGSVGTTLVGYVSQRTSGYAPAILAIAPFPFLAGCIVLMVGYIRRRVPARN